MISSSFAPNSDTDLHQCLLLLYKLPPNLGIMMLMMIMVLSMIMMLMMITMLLLNNLMKRIKHLCLGIRGLCFKQLLQIRRLENLNWMNDDHDHYGEERD